MGKKNKTQEAAYRINLQIEHADDIAIKYRDKPLAYIKKQWYRANAEHTRLVYDVDAWYADAEKLVQAWHDLLGVTAILKHWYEWDESGKCPKLSY